MNQPSYASASLYVGDLLPDCTETQLFDTFKAIGPVASIRVCRDAVTRRSLGYAYVNYHNLGDAERALDILNYKDIKGKPCRIMWSQRDPSLRKSGSGNIFIKNLDKTIDNKILYDTFASFGNILSCKISQDEHGNSKGFGFVHYETAEAAQEAIEKTNGKLISGKKVFVGLFVSRKDRSSTEDEPKWTNVFVKNLSKEVSEEKFIEMMAKYGKITSGYLAKDENGASKGFGFVNFEEHEQAQACIEDLNGKDVDGSPVYVGRAQKKQEREKELKDMFEKLKRERMSKFQGVNLYVKNLDESIDDATLREEFSAAGTITSAKVMRDEKGASKGFGFVCFATPDEATKAVTELNGKMIKDKPIYVALAQRKEARRAQLEAKHAQKVNGIRLQQQAQAQGMTGNPIYATGAPMFYPQPVGRNFVYPGVPGPRFPVPGGFPGAQPRGPGYASGGGYRVSGGMAPRGAYRGRQGKAPNQRQPVPGYPNLKYNANVRNPQQPAPAQTDAERKQMLGENLYPRIEARLKEVNQDPELAGKITGMIIELDPVEVTNIESAEVLNQKIQEALDVLATAEKEEKQQ
jgi:polyadenylate-binding protein